MFKFLISTTNLVFLVAEIGVNWDGNIELASNMMQQAKKLGFNAVKFQSFDESIVGQHPTISKITNQPLQGTIWWPNNKLGPKCGHFSN